MSATLASRLAALADAADRELNSILTWWSHNAVDERHGGFHGEIDAADNPVAGANKGIILNTRILWFFSAAALVQPSARPLADRAYRYVREHFVDPVQGGVLWELDASAAKLNGKKQAYAQAFAIYALSAYFAASQDEDALALATDIFALMQRHYVDPAHGGYIEALDESWKPLADVRLSEVDANYPKTMNTHLHVLEAYTALHAVAPTAEAAAALRTCIDLMARRILDPNSHHLRLFFTLDWEDRTEAISFGHDIEASWLLWEACETLGDHALSAALKAPVLDLAQSALREGVGEDGGLFNERNRNGHVDRARVWWAQAEAMVGFLNAFELSGDPLFLDATEEAWAFIQAHHIDRARGEWTWWSDLDAPAANRSYKAGFWKGPYHNGRAMLEVSQRARRMIAQQQ